MVPHRSKNLILISLSILAAAAACNLPDKLMALSQSEDEGAIQTIQAMETQLVQLQSNPDQDVEGETPQEDQAETDPEPTATETPQPTIEHLVRPGEPGVTNTWVSDTSTKAIADTRESGADLFPSNLYERPFTSEVMDYLAHIDITKVNLNFSDPWVYVIFNLEGAPPEDSTAVYALELDLDSDGRGDWLILGQVPAGSEWTTDGAQAVQDSNSDVGGPAPMSADPPNPSRDGYETMVFDSGVGADPDAVWVRRDPGSANNVQLAFKYSLIGSDNSFTFGGWADEGLKNPGAFDYNDFMTFDQAGSAFAANSKYPIKELAALDSTCRWAYGYTPTTMIPGLCPLPPTPTPTPEPGSIGALVFNDLNGNGTRQSSEPVISFGVKIKLGGGSCSSTGLGSKDTGGSGTATFSNLAPGTYCVTAKVPDWWVATTPTERTVSIAAGENKTPWFGFAETIE